MPELLALADSFQYLNYGENSFIDFKDLLRGVPDGVGFQEDPSYLVEYYSSFESVCHHQTNPQRVGASRAWFPIRGFLEGLMFEDESRWRNMQQLFEAYRFAEAGLATVQMISHDHCTYAEEAFEGLPGHLKARLQS